jgi:hypothetical protein
MISHLRKSLITIPVLGYTLAIVYDVGFFYAIDMRLFSLFSITEHLVFALEALPLAMLIAIIGVLSFFSGWGSARFNLNRIHRRVTSSNSEPEPVSPAALEILEKKLKILRRQLMWLGILMIVFGAIILFMYLFLFHLTSLLVFVALSLVTASLSFTNAFSEFSKSVVLNSIVVGVLLLTIAIAFAMGIDTARFRLTHGNKALVSTPRGDISAMVIRYGDRGLLVYDPSQKQLRLLKWADVKNLDWAYQAEPIRRLDK